MVKADKIGFFAGYSRVPCSTGSAGRRGGGANAASGELEEPSLLGAVVVLCVCLNN